MTVRFKGKNLLVEDNSSGRHIFRSFCTSEEWRKLTSAPDAIVSDGMVEVDFIEHLSVTLAVPDPKSPIAAIEIVKHKSQGNPATIALNFCSRDLSGFKREHQKPGFHVGGAAYLIDQPTEQKEFLETLFMRIGTPNEHNLYMCSVSIDPLNKSLSAIKKSKLISTDDNLNNFICGVLEKGLKGEMLDLKEIDATLNRYEKAMNKPGLRQRE